MRVNEIFYSLQGEGRYTGTPAAFLRLSGCNLRCNFCDTDHWDYKEMSEEEIIYEISDFPTRHIVITGGEPTLQLTASLLRKLHEAGFFIQVETNGTKDIDDDILSGIDWVTCSPKYSKVNIRRIDELKVVYQEQEMEEYAPYVRMAKECYLQPCDIKDQEKNAKNIIATVIYIKENPTWKLSLQTQKLLNVR